MLKDYSSKNFSVVVTSENDLQSARLTDLLSSYNDELKDLIDAGKIKFEVLAIKSGFISKKEKLFVLTDYQIFNKPYRAFLSSKKKYKKSRVQDFASIKRGDYVVHENFGIGQYSGLVLLFRLTADGRRDRAERSIRPAAVARRSRPEGRRPEHCRSARGHR